MVILVGQIDEIAMAHALHLRTQSDADLVLLFQSGKDTELVISEFYQRYHDKVYHYCLRIVHDRDRALDATQEVFLRLAEKLHTLRSSALLTSWLFRIAHNECIDEAKFHQRWRATASEDCLHLADEEFDLDQAQQWERDLSHLDELMRALPEDARNLLYEKYCQGRSIQELMNQYHLSESAVKMRLARARHRMAELYDKQHRAEA